MPRVFRLALLAAFAAAPLAAQDAAVLPAGYSRWEAMIPMRDGVRLHTVFLAPADTTVPAPILMERTPYGTEGWGEGPRFATAYDAFLPGGYVLVQQDIRGRYASEGTFMMNRPPVAPGDSAQVDESTDTYDTIEWMIHHVPGNNGRVGILGISYPGWLSAMAGYHPHPALKAISPQAPMGDAWMGDDFFHQGAFRQSYGLEYAWAMEASDDWSKTPNVSRYDTYEWYLLYPNLRAMAAAVGADAWPTWRNFVAHPSYDAFWQRHALMSYATTPVVPTLTVGGWWDQEDEYGAIASYATLERHDSLNRSYLVMGPWNHGQWHVDPAAALGQVQFGHSTGADFRKEIQGPWFNYWLKGTGDGRFPEARLFDAGANEWKSFDAWPPKDATAVSLYFGDHGRLRFTPPTSATGYDQFVSDPAHPVPYRSRPVELTYDPRGSRWRTWEVEDQRFVDDRVDVLSWETEPLTDDVVVAGDITARLFASTTGSDADWVVKLIDVYPDSLADRPRMGGFELMVTGDVLRGRYRTSFSHPAPVTPNAVLAYNVDLHQQAYRFKAGHRIMVQVQSTWFPLYDRNPQTYVPNIFLADSSAYRARTHRVYRSVKFPSHVSIMVVPR